MFVSNSREPITKWQNVIPAERRPHLNCSAFVIFLFPRLVLWVTSRQCTYKRNMEQRSRNHCCSAKAISITYSDCIFVALGVYNAKRMSRIVFSCASCLTLQYLSTYLTNGTIFEKNLLLNIKCVFWFSIQFFVWNISHYKMDLAKCFHKCTYISLHVKCALFLSDFNETWIFSTVLPEILKCHLAWKFVRWKTSCYKRTDG
jgi:hypothetical protein